MPIGLNQRALELLQDCDRRETELRIASRRLACGTRVYDFGIEARGGLDAGLRLAEICLAGLGRVSLHSALLDGMAWPGVSVWTDHPVTACLGSQYAGWQIAHEKYFAMGSGPMRAVAAHEPLFDQIDLRERAEACVGVLETARMPTDAVCELIAAKCGIAPERLALVAAPTASLAGNLQIVARSVETALHKLHELGWDVTRVHCGFGAAPLPPVAGDDLTGIGRTNDAILYGGQVCLWVTGDDASIAEIGPRVPSSASPASGKTFLQIFEEAGRDFYRIDPHLFSPAEIMFQNLDTGTVHRFGHISPAVLKTSFGL